MVWYGRGWEGRERKRLKSEEKGKWRGRAPGTLVLSNGSRVDHSHSFVSLSTSCLWHTPRTMTFKSLSLSLSSSLSLRPRETESTCTLGKRADECLMGFLGLN